MFLAVLTLLWAAAAALCALKERTQLRGDVLNRDRVPAVLIFTALYAVLCTVSTLASAHPVFTGFGTGRCNGLVTYLLYAVIFAGVYLFGRLKEWHLLLFFAAYSCCCVIVLMQYSGMDPFSLYPDGLNYHSPYIQQVYRFLGTVGNADVLSSLNCLAIPAAVCSFAHISPKLRFIPVIAAILGLGSTFAASVQSGWLALAVTAAVYLPLYLKNTKSEKCRLLIPTGFLALFAAACFVSVLFLPDEAGSSRILIWKSSLEVFRDHPLLGIGPDCLCEYSGVIFRRFSEELGKELTTACDNAHNELLHHLVSFGLAGIVPLAGAAVCLAKKVSAHFLAPALFCYAVQSFFNLGLPIVTPVFIIILALCSRESCSFKQNNMLE